MTSSNSTKSEPTFRGVADLSPDEIREALGFAVQKAKADETKRRGKSAVIREMLPEIEAAIAAGAKIQDIEARLNLKPGHLHTYLKRAKLAAAGLTARGQPRRRQKGAAPKTSAQPLATHAVPAVRLAPVAPPVRPAAKPVVQPDGVQVSPGVMSVRERELLERQVDRNTSTQAPGQSPPPARTGGFGRSAAAGAALGHEAAPAAAAQPAASDDGAAATPPGTKKPKLKLSMW